MYTPDFTNTCGGKTFSFSPYNYYPPIYEGYSNLNEAVADMIARKSKHTNDEILIEFDAANGLLCSLVKDNCKKIYPYISLNHLKKNIVKNLTAHGLIDNDDYEILSKFAKTRQNMHSVIKTHGKDCKLTVVFQSIDSNLPSLYRKMSKSLLLLDINKITS